MNWCPQFGIFFLFSSLYNVLVQEQPTTEAVPHHSPQSSKGSQKPLSTPKRADKGFLQRQLSGPSANPQTAGADHQAILHTKSHRAAKMRQREDSVQNLLESMSEEAVEGKHQHVNPSSSLSSLSKLSSLSNLELSKDLGKIFQGVGAGGVSHNTKFYPPERGGSGGILLTSSGSGSGAEVERRRRSLSHSKSSGAEVGLSKSSGGEQHTISLTSKATSSMRGLSGDEGGVESRVRREFVTNFWSEDPPDKSFAVERGAAPRSTAKDLFEEVDPQGRTNGRTTNGTTNGTEVPTERTYQWNGMGAVPTVELHEWNGSTNRRRNSFYFYPSAPSTPCRSDAGSEVRRDAPRPTAPAKRGASAKQQGAAGGPLRRSSSQRSRQPASPTPASGGTSTGTPRLNSPFCNTSAAARSLSSGPVGGGVPGEILKQASGVAHKNPLVPKLNLSDKRGAKGRGGAAAAAKKPPRPPPFSSSGRGGAHAPQSGLGLQQCPIIGVPGLCATPPPATLVSTGSVQRMSSVPCLDLQRGGGAVSRQSSVPASPAGSCGRAGFFGLTPPRGLNLVEVAFTPKGR